MSYPFKEIVIIYNPKSTGDGKKNALALKRQLDDRLSSVKTELLETEYAGHAEKIGRNYAKGDKQVLLVSSSGDGGYNELVNGVMSVKQHNNVAVCVLPSGNANDHYHSVSEHSLVGRIVAGKTTKIDVLHITATCGGKPWSRFAHSYVGLGLTAYIGKKLTEAKLNPVNEKWLVLKYLVLFRHTALKVLPSQRYRYYSSFVVSNIDRMSKVIKLDASAKIDDGLAELYQSRTKSPFGHIFTLLLGSTIGMKPVEKITSIKVASKYPLEIQCDGEVFDCDKDNVICLEVIARKLATVQ